MAFSPKGPCSSLWDLRQEAAAPTLWDRFKECLAEEEKRLRESCQWWNFIFGHKSGAPHFVDQSEYCDFIKETFKLVSENLRRVLKERFRRKEWRKEFGSVDNTLCWLTLYRQTLFEQIEQLNFSSRTRGLDIYLAKYWSSPNFLPRFSTDFLFSERTKCFLQRANSF